MEDDRTVVIIGAARSGTKILRDLIATLPGVAKVSYDVNYLWRLGNESVTHDELDPLMATDEVRARIVERLDNFRGGKPVLVEKTVSNTLRVPFVRAVLPHARYIHLIRDGRDAAESAYRQWTGGTDWRYVLSKARSFPLRDAPIYALRYAASIVRRSAPGQKRVAVWGPRYDGIDADLRTYDLVEVCARQWARCVARSIAALDSVPVEQLITIRYEDFVRSPRRHLDLLADFIDVDASEAGGEELPVSPGYVGGGWADGHPQLALALPHMERELRLLGYISVDGTPAAE